MITHQEQGSDRAHQRARRIDARRNLEAILEAARCVLPEDPRASMQEIAVAAGVHRATVHRHFASRDDLLAAVRARAFDATVAAVDESLAHGDTPAIDAIERMATAILRVGDRYRLYRFTTWRDAAVDERVDDVSDAMVRLVQAAQAQGDARGDVAPERLAMVFGGVITSVLPEIASGGMTAEQGGEFVRAMLAPPRS